MLAPKHNLPADQRRLLKLYAKLTAQEKENLLAFAEFLSQRSMVDKAVEEKKHEPVSLSKPDDETVIGAIKRLSESYYMLDRSTMLTETSSLMTAHVMHGRSAPDVIDELETLFITNYQQYLSPEE